MNIALFRKTAGVVLNPVSGDASPMLISLRTPLIPIMDPSNWTFNRRRKKFTIERPKSNVAILGLRVLAQSVYINLFYINLVYISGVLSPGYQPHRFELLRRAKDMDGSEDDFGKEFNVVISGASRILIAG